MDITEYSEENMENIKPHMVSSKDTFADSEYIEWVYEAMVYFLCL